MARGWKVLLVTSVGVYLVALDVTIVNIAFPAIAADFAGTSRAALSWILSGYSIAFAASLLTAGRIADRAGRRRIFYTGIAIFSAASALAGLAPSVALLVAARVIQAVGGALVVPSALALVLPEFPVERRSAAIGVWGAVGGIAAATGPSLGSLLTQGIGWRAVFFVNIPACLIAWFAGRRLLVESRDSDRSIPDIAGALLGFGGVALLVLTLVQGDAWGWTDARVIASAVGALVLLPAFVRRSARHPSPVLDLSLFRLRFFTVANAATFVFSIAFFAMLLHHVLYLTSVWSYSILGAGIALTPGPLAAAAVAAPAGRLADRYGHRALAVPGTILFALGTWALASWTTPEPAYWRVFFGPQVLIGTGVGMTIATLVAAANAFLPPERYGMGSAFSQTSRQVGAAVGIAFLVVLLGEAGQDAFERVWVFLGSVSLVAGALMAALYRGPVALLGDQRRRSSRHADRYGSR